MTIRTVGVVGLGAMGLPMCRHLVSAGFEVVGFDPSASAAATAAEVGVRVVGSPSDLAKECEIALIVVGFEEQVEEVLFGDQGLVAGARPQLVIGLASTVSPAFARDLAERLGAHDVRLLDMPITRGEPAAEAGTLLVLGGADPDLFDECTPVLRAFASDVFNLGAFGSGQVAKMVNNMIMWACIAANEESLNLGARLGVDPDLMREALVHSSASNFAMIERIDRLPLPWAEKDLRIAQVESDHLRFSIPVAGLVKEVIKDFKVRTGQATPTS